MGVVEGQLKKLGNAAIRNDRTRYSLIEIGDQIITNVLVSNKLDNFLSDGLKTDAPTKLWIFSLGFGNKGLAALQVGGGTRYISSPLLTGLYIFQIILSSIFAFFGFAAGDFWIWSGVAFVFLALLNALPIARFWLISGSGIKL